MRNYFNHIMRGVFGTLMALLVLGMFWSCSDDKDDVTPPEEGGRLILIYAVAANNLEYYLTLDVQEIISVAPNLNLDTNAVLLYAVGKDGECRLSRLVYDRTTRSYKFEKEKGYDPLPLSTSKERISEVLEYVDQNYAYPLKGLIFWSHGTGWLPWFAGGTPPPRSNGRYAYGEDIFEGNTYKTNITDLAEAIPENVFDFIWFDCCYMGNIETFYQIRKKTPLLIGSVMEIDVLGMPYNLTMPYLLKKEPDFKEAVNKFFTYYENRNTGASLTIVKTDRLEQLADASKAIFEEGTPPEANVLADIQNYSTLRDAQGFRVYFYDMGMLLKNFRGVSEQTLVNFQNAMDDAIEYKVSTLRGWGNIVVPPENFSGLSIHHYINNNSDEEIFYSELDWFKATR